MRQHMNYLSLSLWKILLQISWVRFSNDWGTYAMRWESTTWTRLQPCRLRKRVSYITANAVCLKEYDESYSFFFFPPPQVYQQPFYSLVPLLVKKSVSAAEQEMWKKSFGFFEKGMKDFEAIGDSTNTALLLCNTGRLMRICAQAHCNLSGDEGRGEFSPEEALYYNKVPRWRFLKFLIECSH